MRFVKMEGAGNDYIYVDAISQKIDYAKETVRRLSDRHYGIGSDGLIALEKSATCDFKMRMFNSDGSEGKMCGNGLRCLAKFAYDQGYTKKKTLTFETLAGERKVSLIMDHECVVGATVDMGMPILTTKDIPMSVDQETFIMADLVVEGETYPGVALSMGNPHYVVFVNHLTMDIIDIADKIMQSHYFPDSVNVEFVQIIDRKELNMRVIERGAGETLACGTGACAAMYAAYLINQVDKKVKVNLLGGTLYVSLEDGHILLTGQARTVFRGEYDE